MSVPSPVATPSRLRQIAVPSEAIHLPIPPQSRRNTLEPVKRKMQPAINSGIESPMAKAPLESSRFEGSKADVDSVNMNDIVL